MKTTYTGCYTLGLEYAVVPAIACPLLYGTNYYGLAGSLLSGSVITILCGVLAIFRGEQLRKVAVEGKVIVDRLDPAYPTFVGIGLFAFAILQVILSISHWSYFRKGHPLGMLGEGM